MKYLAAALVIISLLGMAVFLITTGHPWWAGFFIGMVFLVHADDDKKDK
jgi:hypothetical protein